MTDVIENQKEVEGEIQSPNEIIRQFKTFDAAIDFAKWARPAAFTVQSGVDEGGKAVWQIIYHTQNRS